MSIQTDCQYRGESKVVLLLPMEQSHHCTMVENSHFSVTSQNIFSQSQKYFDTSIIYFLKNIWLQSNLQFSSKLEMSISFKWKVLENFFYIFRMKLLCSYFWDYFQGFHNKESLIWPNWHLMAHCALTQASLRFTPCSGLF